MTFLPIAVTTVGVFIVASIGMAGENGYHRWGPWVAVAAGLIAMAVAS